MKSAADGEMLPPVSILADLTQPSASLIVAPRGAFAGSQLAPEANRFRECSSCGSAHLGPVPCGLTFAERLRTVQVNEAGMETVERKNYFDRAAVTEAFGDDAKDRYWDETEGRGHVERDERGEMFHRDFRGDVLPVTDDDLAFYTDEGETSDVV